MSSSQTTLGRRWHLSWASNSDPAQNLSSAPSHQLSSAPTSSLPIVFSFLADHRPELSHSEGLVRCQAGGGPGKGKQEQQGKSRRRERHKVSPRDKQSLILQSSNRAQTCCRFLVTCSVVQAQGQGYKACKTHLHQDMSVLRAPGSTALPSAKHSSGAGGKSCFHARDSQGSSRPGASHSP